MTTTEPISTIGGDDGGPIQVVSAASVATLDDWDIAAHVKPGPDRAFIVGRYVHGGNPPNRNGHVFRLDQLPEAMRLIPHAPLDMLHDPNRIVGTFAASTMVHPTPTARQATPAFTEAPFVKVLAAVWSYHFPAEAQKIREAYENGTAFLSHSCLPEAVECPTCRHRAAWDGYTSDTYCSHMQGVNAKEFDTPWFLGGGVIIPPIRPGWGDAFITKVERFSQTHNDKAQAALELLGGDATALELEAMALMLLGRAYPDHPDMGKEVRRLVAPKFIAPTVTAAEEQRGVIVALVPPESIRKAISDAGDQPVEEIHLTLAYLGDVEDGMVKLDEDAEPVTLDALAAAVAVWSDGERPIMASTSGSGQFAQPDGSIVNYVSVDAPGLNEMRARLIGALESAGIAVADSHGFTPHITVSYAGDLIESDKLSGASWMIDSVEVWWAGAHAEVEFG